MASVVYRNCAGLQVVQLVSDVIKFIVSSQPRAPIVHMKTSEIEDIQKLVERLELFFSTLADSPPFPDLGSVDHASLHIASRDIKDLCATMNVRLLPELSAGKKDSEASGKHAKGSEAMHSFLPWLLPLCSDENKFGYSFV